MQKLILKSRKNQLGIAKFGLLSGAVLIGLLLTAGLKVGPLYMHHYLITDICQELLDNGEANNMTVSDVRLRVSNALRLNNVTGFNLDAIRMRRQNGSAIITIAYERRLPLVANLDVVAVFDTTIQ